MEQTEEEIKAAEEAKAAEGEGDEGGDEGDKKTAEELEEELKETREELEKEKEKGKNFKGLKDQEKGKRKKIGERIDDLEAQVKQGVEDRQTLQDSIMKDAKSVALEQLAGEDKDLRAKLEERVKASDTYLGSPKDSKELTERYENAYSFLEGSQRKVNPLHAHHPVTGSQNDMSSGKGKRYTDTPEGKDLLKSKFPKIAALEEKKKDK